MTNEFVEFARKTLIEELGDSGENILSMVLTVKPVNDKSSPDEISEFIATIESGASAAGDQEQASEIGLVLRNKAQEMEKIPSIEKVEGLDAEIEDFLKKNDLPTERDILDYTKYLTMKYGGSAEKVEKDLIERVRTHVKNAISRNKINEEISRFLGRFLDPSNKDVDEFIKYIRLLKLNFQEEELREKIEKERLFRKFHGSQEASTLENPGIGEFINLIRTNDKEAISEAIQKQGLSYLIKNESGASGKGLSEFIELVTPSEDDLKDTLEGLGFEHLIKKKNSK